MNKLHNYVLGAWTAGEGEGQQLHHAITGAVVAEATSKGINFEDVLNYGRTIGGHKLRKMTFQERGRMLKALALYLQERKETYYALSYATGATRADSWIDIEGGIGNLFSYASLRRQFPDLPYHVDGDAIKSSKNGTFIGQHICTPKQGVAIHINAFNFPVWGMLEKIAVNLLAGMPAVVKPATITSFLTELVTKDIIASGILPEGSLQLICGSANGILDTVCNQDVVTFTGSAHTGKMLKAHPQILAESVPFNLEADSLNAMVLGLDAVPGTVEFDLFIKEATKEMTIKAGQKCTAVRRLIVPENCMEDVQIALGKRLGGVVMGNPQTEGVRMGALAGVSQVEEVTEKVELLSKTQNIVYGNYNNLDIIAANSLEGAFSLQYYLPTKNHLRIPTATT
jgi:oxepin-CoA hydrolase / 3-oxo-5,6-dehydrosuberyl-CoA semialdehyde dehydrogenase